jgi:hypothetical protein
LPQVRRQTVGEVYGEGILSESILAEALNLVQGDRNDTYGDGWDDYSRAVEIFEALSGVKLSVEQAILFMVSVKLSRNKYAAQLALPPDKRRDNLVDASGYLELYWQAIERNYDDRQTNPYRL